MKEFGRRTIIRRLLTLLVVLIVFIVGIALGATSISPIQKPNQQLNITLLNGVKLDAVQVTDWTNNIVSVTIESPATVQGTLTLSTDNHGYASNAYTISQINSPIILSPFTLNASLLNANVLTVKT